MYFKAKKIEEKNQYTYNNTSKNKEEVNSESDILNKISKTSDIDKKLMILTEEFNKNLPQQIDEITVLSKIEKLSNKEIRYCYTILDKGISLTKEQIENQKHTLVREIKTSSNFKLFREYKVTMSYAYYDSNGENIAIIRITPNEYQ